MEGADCTTGSVLRKVGFGIRTLLFKLYMVLEWELLDDVTISLKDRDSCICSYSTCSVSAYQSIYNSISSLAPSCTFQNSTFIAIQITAVHDEVDHGSPVECGCPFPNAALYASGGGTSVKVWDVAMTGRTLQDLPDAHSKAGNIDET